MTKSEIQSVEVSFFVHATEDEPRLLQCIEASLHLGATPKLEQLRGHFGNGITHVSYHLTGADAARLFVSLASQLGMEEANAILERIDTMMDEHRALYLRLSKQQLVSGKIALASNDSVRLKVKPRSFMIGRDARTFYAKIMRVPS
jgi:RNA binding exosome subunit